MSENKSTELVPVEITVESLRTKIYSIRGQRVMLATDLAEIYGYTTKAFNQQVKNNIEKFELLMSGGVKAHSDKLRSSMRS